MPLTALITVEAARPPSVKRSAATAWRLEIAFQNVSKPPSVERHDDGREREQDDEAQPQRRDPKRERARPGEPGASAG